MQPSASMATWRDHAKQIHEQRANLANNAKRAYTSFLRPHLEEAAQMQGQKTRQQIYSFLGELLPSQKS